jgi:DNA-binding protein
VASATLGQEFDLHSIIRVFPGVEYRPEVFPRLVFRLKKPLMAYATAMMMHFQTGAKELSVKARGRAISTAVDVVEVVSRRFYAGKLNIKNISIGTEAVGEGDDIRNVSTIEIRVELLA